MSKRVAHRAVYLRNAAHGVGVLHLLALAVRLADQAALQHAAQVLRHQQLSRVRTGLVNALVEGDVGAPQRVYGERANHVGRVHQDFHLQRCQQSDGQHALGAVDERDGLLGLQHQRLDVGLLQRAGGRHALAVKHGLAFADQHQSQMRQRRQIAAGPHAALRGNDGVHPTVQHLAKCVDDHRPHSREALGHGIGAQQKHGARDIFPQRFADTGTMRAQQIDLEGANLVRWDPHVGELADAGIHGIGDAVLFHQFIDHGARPLDGKTRFRLQQNRPPLMDDLAHLIQGQVVPVDMEGLHKNQSSVARAVSEFCVNPQSFLTSAAKAGRPWHHLMQA